MATRPSSRADSAGRPAGPPADLAVALLADLDAERAALTALLDDLPADRWRVPTPAPGWSVRDQAAHLAFFDDMAALSVAAPDAFAAERARADEDTPAYQRDHLDRVPGDGTELLTHWRRAAERFRAAVLGAPAGTRAPWFGPDMSVPSMMTARLMETWTHGHDITEALGVRREPGDRLRHVVSLAVRARGYGYVVRGMEPSTVPVRVELAAPSGGTWTFGPDDAAETITGPAEDFCLVLTRRRHVDDTDLVVRGDAARTWMEIGQAYAGPPGDGPRRTAS